MPDSVKNGPNLSGKKVAFTGRLTSMTREKAAELVQSHGGEYIPTLTRDTDTLVIGQYGWPLQSDGHLTKKLEKALLFQKEGCPIRISGEDEFFKELSPEEQPGNIQRLYTISQLSRILDIPKHRIQTWVRSGIIAPARSIHRLHYFDFHQVAGAKVLSDLVSSGATLERVRRSLGQLHEWLPDLEQPLSQLVVMENKGPLLVRLEGGQLAEPTGQLLFDFAISTEAPQSDAPVVERPPSSLDEWFQVAMELEESGQLGDAAKAYYQALMITGPQPELCFNLANVLYAQNKKEQAVERFRQAVEIDSEYVEAWNNLGKVLTELGQLEEATEAYRKALAVVPDYADAHYNLAETLNQLDLTGEARPHWEAYLKLDPSSSWADHVRERLRNHQE